MIDNTGFVHTAFMKKSSLVFPRFPISFCWPIGWKYIYFPWFISKYYAFFLELGSTKFQNQISNQGKKDYDIKKEAFLFSKKNSCSKNNIKKSVACLPLTIHYIIFFLLSWSTHKTSSALQASSCFSWDFLFNAFPFNKNSKFLFFSDSTQSLRNSVWKLLLILMLSAIESFTSSISQSIMANWAHYACCFRKDSFSLKNSCYLFQEHLTDFNRVFVTGNDCGKRLWLFIWSMINLWKVIDIWCM